MSIYSFILFLCYHFNCSSKFPLCTNAFFLNRRVLITTNQSDKFFFNFNKKNNLYNLIKVAKRNQAPQLHRSGLRVWKQAMEESRQDNSWWKRTMWRPQATRTAVSPVRLAVNLRQKRSHQQKKFKPVTNCLCYWP